MRRFPVRIIIAAAAVGGGYAAARVLAPGGLPRESAPPAQTQLKLAANAGGGAASSDGRLVGEDGNRIVLGVLDALERRLFITARLRQSLAIGDRRLSGEGRYWQQGVGNQRRSRWELKTLVAGEQAFFTEVYAHFPEGEYVWTDRRLPYSRVVSRVDVATVRRAFGAIDALPDQETSDDEVMEAELLARGGLSQLFAELKRNFSFGPATPSQTAPGMVAILGSWRPDQLARNWPSVAGGEWPEHLPHHVLVEIGGVDYFPYVIEYRRAADAELANANGSVQAAADPLARYEFFDVNFAVAMPEHIFDFSHADFDWQDVTARVIERLRGAAPPQTADAATIFQVPR